MKITPATSLRTRTRPEPARSEFITRYAAAYGCTLIAVAAAQLIIPNQWAALLALVTLIGMPISIYLRQSNLKIFGRPIPRFLINSSIVVMTAFACFYLLLAMQPEVLSRGLYDTLLLTTRSAGESIAILMNMFLIFAVFRSLAIINDKDAVLSAVPSFSVLLLLIVVHRGPQVVAYFLLWAVTAAILFSLDHRADNRRHLSGVVPSLVPGQDVKLSTRGLMTVMSFSLFCAVSISYYLSSRNPEERGVLESWILGMAGRMTQLALNIPDVSVNSGPERQIDYSSGPALPTRAELWSVAAIDYRAQPLQPQYWRMFTLSRYDGATWSQIPGSGSSVPLQRLNPKRWPPLQTPSSRASAPQASSPQNSQSRESQTRNSPSRNNASGPTFQIPENRTQPTGNRRLKNQTLDNQPLNAAGAIRRIKNQQNTNRQNSMPQNRNQRRESTLAPRGAPSNNNNSNSDTAQFYRRRRLGYDIGARHPFGAQMMRNFGGNRHMIIQLLEARVSNVGFVPALPAPRAFRIRTEKPPANLRVRQDGGIDVGVLETGQPAVILSEVAPGFAYGRVASKDLGPPMLKSKRPNPRAAISNQERKANIGLTPALLRSDSRLRRFVQATLKNSPATESDYARGRRLSIAIQASAVYTLRPPQIPEGRDAAEYFLFDSRRGYCTYFAGALTVACRVAGIPARVVSGFVNPDWSTSGGQVGILREANAHAWTEIWVDGWGWTPLDATPPDNRGQNAPEWWENWTDFFASKIDAVRNWISARWNWIVYLSLALIPAIFILASRRGFGDALTSLLNRSLHGRVAMSRDQSQRMVSRAYERALKKTARRFRRRIAWETPREYLAAAEAALDLENAMPLREITRLYERAEYSPETVKPADGERAYKALRELSFRKRRETKEIGDAQTSMPRP